jgi:acetyltransferase
MALIVETQRGDEIWGVARFFADPDNVRAEFAVAVRSDLKGRGLGYALMTRLIDVARSREISELFGDVLSENDVMLRMCRGLGFKIESHPVEPGIVRVILDLNVT